MTKSKQHIEESIQRLRNHNIKMVGDYLGSKTKTLFECPYCFVTFFTTPNRILREETKSCGCSRGRALRKGTDNISKSYWTSLIVSAKRRDILFSIDIEYVECLLINQDFKCALSGLDIVAGYGNKISNRNGPDGPTKKKHTASLDRINSSIGYVKENVQWLHVDVNFMKHAYDQDYFLEICRLCTSNSTF